MTVTIRDVAKRAEVGIGTVSRVINGSPNVRDSTRSRVLVAIEELDYEPNASARRLSLGKTHSIGVIAPFFTTSSCVERLRGIEHAISNTEYDFMLFNVDTVARRDYHFQNAVRRHAIDGLIIITLIPTEKDIDRFSRRHIPTMLLDQKHPHLNFIAVDDAVGGEIATQHLIDLGHRKIGLISDFLADPLLDPFDFTSGRDRFSGYCRALEKAGIPVRPEYHKQGPHARKFASDLGHELLSMPDRPTAIFCTSDTQAIGLMQAARDLGISIPDQLSVIGYDDIELSSYLNLTTVRQPLFESGKAAVELMFSMLNLPSQVLQQTILTTELVERGTTSPLTETGVN